MLYHGRTGIVPIGNITWGFWLWCVVCSVSGDPQRSQDVGGLDRLGSQRDSVGDSEVSSSA
jgi:hypothetical protein